MMPRLVPQRAVSELQGGYQVAVVDSDNKVAHSNGAERSWSTVVGTQWMSCGRLPGAGEQVVAEGVQKVRIRRARESKKPFGTEN